MPRALSHVYYSPLTPENTREVEKIFNSLASENPKDPPIRNRKLNTWGRTILVPESTSTIAKFDFHDLCGQPLSAADYIEVTKNFGTVFVLNIPKMGMQQKDLVRHLLYLCIRGILVFPTFRREDSSLSLMVRQIMYFYNVSHTCSFTQLAMKAR